MDTNSRTLLEIIDKNKELLSSEDYLVMMNTLKDMNVKEIGEKQMYKLTFHFIHQRLPDHDNDEEIESVYEIKQFTLKTTLKQPLPEEYKEKFCSIAYYIFVNEYIPNESANFFKQMVFNADGYIKCDDSVCATISDLILVMYEDA